MVASDVGDNFDVEVCGLQILIGLHLPSNGHVRILINLIATRLLDRQHVRTGHGAEMNSRVHKTPHCIMNSRVHKTPHCIQNIFTNMSTTVDSPLNWFTLNLVTRIHSE